MRHLLKSVFLFTALAGLAACGGTQSSTASAERPAESSAPTKMTPEAIAELVKSFDPEAKVQANGISFRLQDRDVLIVHDEESDRMRAISPIAPASLLNEVVLLRMAQANYDSVLDARYAVANDLIWSVYIHPLGSLQQEDLISAIAQVVTSAETFGRSYTSGAIVFGGGDSSEIHNDLIEKLEEAAKKKDAI